MYATQKYNLVYRTWLITVLSELTLDSNTLEKTNVAFVSPCKHYLRRGIFAPLDNGTVLTCNCTKGINCVILYPFVERTLHEIASPLYHLDVIFFAASSNARVTQGHIRKNKLIYTSHMDTHKHTIILLFTLSKFINLDLTITTVHIS